MRARALRLPTSAVAVAGSPFVPVRARPSPSRRLRCPRAPVQNTLPDDALPLEAAFSSAGSVSRRALTMPCNVSGSGARRRTLLEVELGELLRVERVAAGAIEERLLDVVGKQRALEQRRRAGRRSGRRTAVQRKGGRVELAAAPDQAGARGARVELCRRRASGRRSPSRPGRRRSRAGRRRPSGGLR